MKVANVFRAKSVEGMHGWCDLVWIWVGTASSEEAAKSVIGEDVRKIAEKYGAEIKTLSLGKSFYEDGLTVSLEYSKGNIPNHEINTYAIRHTFFVS